MLTMALPWYMNRIVHALSSHHWTLQKDWWIPLYQCLGDCWSYSTNWKVRYDESYFISPLSYSVSVPPTHSCTLAEHFKSAAGLLKVCYFRVNHVCPA